MCKHKRNKAGDLVQSVEYFFMLRGSFLLILRLCKIKTTSDAGCFVELEGVEPSSKQENHMLSTRLVIGEIFERRQDRDRQPAPYPLRCCHCIEACNG